jgi:hypothetical protein
MALGSIQPPRQCVQVALSPEVKQPGREVTTQFHLMPKLGTSGAIPPLPNVPSWREYGQLYFYLCILYAINNVKWEGYSIIRTELLFHRVWSDSAKWLLYVSRATCVYCLGSFGMKMCLGLEWSDTGLYHYCVGIGGLQMEREMAAGWKDGVSGRCCL